MALEMLDENIFVDEKGRQIKFFIQKDLDVTIISNLQEQITTNGGRIESKVPLQGFILIEPNSAEGTRLIDCWDTPDRPLRYFVPHTYVAFCLKAHKLIPQIFRKNDSPLSMHIHPCISDPEIRERLQGLILHSGGKPISTEFDADIVIADEKWPGFLKLVDKYDHCHSKYVEDIGWVETCVDSGVYKSTPVVKKNLGGRIAGNRRIEFTETDDANLAKYIACRLPDSTMRGRTGNKLYQDLCSHVDLYPWAERHPWQSWRERYKNNVSRFTFLISKCLEKHPIPEDGKGLHGFVRGSSTPSKSQSKQMSGSHSEPRSAHQPKEADKETSDDEVWQVRIGKKSPPSWATGKRKDIDGLGTRGSNKRRKNGTGHTRNDSPLSNLPEGKKLFRFEATPLQSGNSSLEPASVSETRSPWIQDTRSQHSQGPFPSGLSDNVEVPEEGMFGSETQALLEANRAFLASSSKTDAMTSNLLTVCISPAAEQELVRIACQYQFLLDEVKGEYKELGYNLEATKSHFEDIRAYITKQREMRNVLS